MTTTTWTRFDRFDTPEGAKRVAAVAMRERVWDAWSVVEVVSMNTRGDGSVNWQGFCETACAHAHANRHTPEGTRVHSEVVRACEDCNWCRE